MCVCVCVCVFVCVFVSQASGADAETVLGWC